MLIPFVLFVGLLLATAIIAHVSDTLGKRLGKKRVSVLGLRPRHTATVLTIGSSWGIMIFTLAVLLAVVAPLRNALFYYESEKTRLTQEREKTEGELRTAQKSVAELQAKSTNLQGDVVEYQGRSRKFQQQSRNYQNQAQEFKGQAQDAQRNFQNAQRGEQTAKKGAQAALLTARNAQASARAALADAKTARSQQIAAQTALATTQSSLQVAEGRLSTAQNRLQTAKEQYKAAQERLKEAGQQIVRAGQLIIKSGQKVVQAQKEAVQAQKEAVEAQKEVEQAKQEVVQARAEVTDLRTRAARIVNDLDQYSAQFEFGNIRLPVHQTLAERRFDTTRPVNEITRELRIIVDAARTATDKIFDNRKDLEFVVGTTVADKSGGLIELNEAETIDFYANVLAESKQIVSARLVSVSNYPSTTSVVVARFVLVPIRTIYIARQDIAEATINTNKSESAIFGQLQDLVESARRKALDNGANPPLVPDPDAPNFFFDGDTGQKMFAALRQIQEVGHPVKVRIVAARDLDSAEPLQIRFVVGDET